MGALKDTIFCDIRSDYNQNQKNSFLYRYLKHNNAQLKEKFAAHPEKEADYIHKAATDLMYNHGYALSEKVKKSANRKRSNNTILELIDAWYDDTLSRKRGKPVSLFSDEHISEADFQKLFDELNKSGKTEVIIPVKIDPLSGAGLYIMGKDLFPKGEFMYAKSYSCGFCIMSLSDVENDMDGNYGARLNFGFDPLSLGAPPNVREALKFFVQEINESRADSGYMEQVWDNNGKMPKNCPESLKIYFADYAKYDDFAENTEEDILEAKTDYDMK